MGRELATIIPGSAGDSFLHSLWCVCMFREGKGREERLIILIFCYAADSNFSGLSGRFVVFFP